MPEATTYQCPDCGGVLAFDVRAGKLTCAFCGGTFSGGEVERAIPLDAGAAGGELEHVTTVEGFLQHAPWEAAVAIAGPMLYEFVREGDIPGLLYLVPIVVLLMPYIVDQGFKGQMNTAVEVEDDGLDYSSGGLVVTESWNGPKFHFSRDKALADFESMGTAKRGGRHS